MDKGRMEAFSDGVIAIIITVMVLGIGAPVGDGLSDLVGVFPALGAYALSFVGVGTYWNNHHHLLKLVRRVDGRMLWLNLGFLFVLSLVPLATEWMEKSVFSAIPTTTYVVLNVLLSLSYMALESDIHHSIASGFSRKAPEEVLRRSTMKERLTLVAEAAAFVLSLALPSSHLALVPLALGYALWIVPDMRIVHLLDFLADADDAAGVEVAEEPGASAAGAGVVAGADAATDGLGSEKGGGAAA